MTPTSLLLPIPVDNSGPYHQMTNQLSLALAATLSFLLHLAGWRELPVLGTGLLNPV